MGETIKSLKEKCYQGRTGNLDWWARNISTKISIRLTYLLIHTNVTGNNVTFAMIILGIFSSYLFSRGGEYAIYSALLLHFIIILDGVDGELARYRNTPSLKGEFLDRFYHIITFPLVFFGVMIGLTSVTQNFTIVIAGYLSSVFYSLNRLIDLEYAEIKVKKTSDKSSGNGSLSFFRGLYYKYEKYVMSPAGTKIMTILLTVGAFTTTLDLVLFFYAGLLPLFVVSKFVYYLIQVE